MVAKSSQIISISIIYTYDIAENYYSAMTVAKISEIQSKEFPLLQGNIVRAMHVTLD